jgi:hypothetical protein
VCFRLVLLVLWLKLVTTEKEEQEEEDEMKNGTTERTEGTEDHGKAIICVYLCSSVVKIDLDQGTSEGGKAYASICSVQGAGWPTGMR